LAYGGCTLEPVVGVAILWPIVCLELAGQSPSQFHFDRRLNDALRAVNSDRRGLQASFAWLKWIPAALTLALVVQLCREHDHLLNNKASSVLAVCGKRASCLSFGFNAGTNATS
jgi:hypothetical protein